jgi:hypothetical protein
VNRTSALAHINSLPFFPAGSERDSQEFGVVGQKRHPRAREVNNLKKAVFTKMSMQVNILLKTKCPNFRR